MILVSVAATSFTILLLFSLPSCLHLCATPFSIEGVGAGASSPYSSDTSLDTDPRSGYCTSTMRFHSMCAPSFSPSSDVPFIFSVFTLFFLPNLLPPPTVAAASRPMRRVFPPSKPPDGGHPPSFRLIVGGTQLRGSWYLSAIVWLQGFSSCSPAAPLHRRSPRMVTSSLMVGESEPGCGLCPSLSLKDFHHQGWGGECAELGSAPAWAAARSFTQ
jgi:hypothetical protein